MRDEWPDTLYDEDEWPDEIRRDDSIRLGRVDLFVNGQYMGKGDETELFLKEQPPAINQEVKVKVKIDTTFSEGEAININDETYNVVKVLSEEFYLHEGHKLVTLLIKPFEWPE